MYSRNKIIIGLSLLLAHASAFCMLSPEDRKKTEGRIEKTSREQNIDYVKTFGRTLGLSGVATLLSMISAKQTIALAKTRRNNSEGNLSYLEKFIFASIPLTIIAGCGFAECTLGQDDPNTKTRIAGGVLGLVGSLGISKYLPYPKS